MVLVPGGRLTAAQLEAIAAAAAEAEEASDSESDTSEMLASAPSTPRRWSGAMAKEDEDYTVKNTFINTPLQRSPSFDEFFGVRKVHSSPPSLAAVPLNRAIGCFGISTPSVLSARNSEADLHMEAAEFCLEQELEKCNLGSASDLGSGSTRAQTLDGRPTAIGSGTFATGSGAVSEVSRAPHDAVEPVLGSKELPSVGSALHAWGACKPCAFIGSNMCRNDINCQFCHLCEPGEKKRRRKEWLETKREQRRHEEAVAAAILENARRPLVPFPAGFAPAQLRALIPVPGQWAR